MMRSATAILALCVSCSLFAAGHDLTASPPTSNQNLPVVTGNGAGFTAAWTDITYQHAVMSRGVSGSGEPAGVGSAIGERPASSMAIAHSPFDTLVVFNDGNVSAVRLSPSGVVLNTILLWSGSPFQFLDVAVAWNGSRYFVIWSGSRELTGAFISPGGSSTQPRIFLTEPNLLEHLTHPEVAWDGQHFVVVVHEAPAPDCSCPATPNQFRVMRVSADGDAIDASPLVITGSHLRAHVASSGSESLITLDGAGGVSTIIAHDGNVLTLDAETPLFPWYTNISSAVAWNGLTYSVAWRYVTGYLGLLTGPGWMGAAQVTRAGFPFDYRITAVRVRFASNSSVCAAANDAGTTALVTQEFAEGSSYLRARLYLSSELAPMPAPPPAPTNVVSFVFGPYARIDWQATGADNGFVLDVSGDSGKQWTTASYVLPPDVRSATVTGTLGALYRVRALGPGGSSEGTITRIVSSDRRRAERP